MNNNANNKTANLSGNNPKSQGRPGMSFGASRRGKMDIDEDKRFDEQMLHIDRVARVVKGGRRFRFRALVVVGDHKALVGIGIAKGADVTSAVTKANEVAKKNMIKVPLYRDTIPHDVEAKVGGSRILLKPASAGTGLIAGGVVRTILEVAGVGNVLSKSLGSSNKANTAYATLAALKQLKPASEWTTRINSAAAKVDTAKAKLAKEVTK
jgi:small subunit ribosomal protein S5